MSNAEEMDGSSELPSTQISNSTTEISSEIGPKGDLQLGHSTSLLNNSTAQTPAPSSVLNLNAPSSLQCLNASNPLQNLDPTKIPKGKSRVKWDSQVEFVLSCVGYAVGIGNLVRFPYICMRNGGGAFLIPYTLFMLVCGLPLLLMELAIGQYARVSAINLWEMCPIFKGTLHLYRPVVKTTIKNINLKTGLSRILIYPTPLLIPQTQLKFRRIPQIGGIC